MSLEILDQLEGKIKQAVETIQLLQLEVEELKGQKKRSIERGTPQLARTFTFAVRAN